MKQREERGPGELRGPQRICRNKVRVSEHDSGTWELGVSKAAGRGSVGEKRQRRAGGEYILSYPSLSFCVAWQGDIIPSQPTLLPGRKGHSIEKHLQCSKFFTPLPGSCDLPLPPSAVCTVSIWKLSVNWQVLLDKCELLYTGNRALRLPFWEQQE